MEEQSKYQKHYSADGFWAKLTKVGREAGMKVVYCGLLLYYALESPKTPIKAKVQIYGALGYLILPLDVVPDLLPAVGYVDDLGALMLALGAVTKSIDSSVKQKASQKLKDFFGEKAASSSEVIEVEAQLQLEEPAGPR
ncbi:Protein of unknown function [Paenibacillus sp. UNCCL117]|uniref:YkvA family protein n=1 Tax=unclassified Paenibacillus TaxID=185978 RepID=UPI000884F3F6|nr:MULTISPECIES: YkvA family protein [unclassified Paenibacillus]SDD48922.1 Protein of unknown function [Paenibacillus sp. cl123]SFW50126.1 Protein of unknown function [Paenibacillus sp. UNCCL117]